MTKTRLLMFSTLLCINTAQAFDNEPDGFRGITWGTELAANASEMSLTEESGIKKFYMRKGDKLTIGDAKLTDVGYYYWNDKFAGAMMRTKGISDETALILALKTTFGEGSKPNRYLDKYYWYGATTTISLNCNSVSHDCMAFIRSTQITQEAADHEKNSAKKAAGDF